MGSTKLDDKPVARSFSRHLLEWFLALRALRWTIYLSIALSLFYAEENWRGKRAWDCYKHEQKSKGMILDWSLKTQPTVPDKENFYLAPGMMEWFLKTPANSPSQRINSSGFPALRRNRLLKVAVEIVPFRADGEPEPANVDLVLEYDPPVMRFYRSPDGATALPPAPDTNRIPLIVMDDVPLSDAIRNLARQAGVNYMLAPNAVGGPQPAVSLRWEEITAMQALRALLQNHNLLLVPDPKSGVSRIVPKDPNQSPVVLDEGVCERLDELVCRSFGPFVSGIQGVQIFVRPIDEAKPVRLAIRTHAPLGVREVAFLTSRQNYVYGETLLKRLSIKETPNHSFFVVVQPYRACVASDYLDWSDRFETDFDQLREALKRPYAVPPGISTDLASMPVEDLLSMRTLGQTLAQRAQSRLLLGQPDQAFKELTLLHDFRRIIDGPPTNRHTMPTTACMNAYLAGLHANVVADGLHMNAWKEPELAALQAQLENVNLLPTLMRAFADQPAFNCSKIEKEIAQPSQTPRFGSSWSSLAQKLNSQGDLMLEVVPRGRIYHGLVGVSELLQRLNDVMDSSGRFVAPRKVGSLLNDVQALVSHVSVESMLAACAFPNVVHLHLTMAYTQTTINQVALACALERYRLHRNRYPDSMEALSPEFVRVLPVDIINGRPLQYCRNPEHGYQLYSVGWDEKDDKGVPADDMGGDWTWRFPMN